MSGSCGSLGGTCGRAVSRGQVPGARVHEAVLVLEGGVPVVVDFSGCPGESEKAKYPNWVTCAWPPHFQQILAWQWEKKVAPYWIKRTQFAADHGVKIAIEMLAGQAGLIALKQTEGWRVAAAHGIAPAFLSYLTPLLAEEKVAELDVSELNRMLKELTYTASQGLLNGTALPLAAHGQVIGVIFIFITGIVGAIDIPHHRLIARCDGHVVARLLRPMRTPAPHFRRPVLRQTQHPDRGTQQARVEGRFERQTLNFELRTLNLEQLLRFGASLPPVLQLYAQATGMPGQE